MIADQVGDNVGDCAGRGSDLFESISDDYITAMLLGSMVLSPLGVAAQVYPLMLGAVGILATIVGIFVTRQWGRLKPLMSFNVTLFATAALCVVGAYVASVYVLGDVRVFYAVVSGLVASLAVGLVVQYYMGINGRPIREVAECEPVRLRAEHHHGPQLRPPEPVPPLRLRPRSPSSSPTTITDGSLYGIVGANLGTDLAIGIIMSSDAFGPISDNAAGHSRDGGLKTNMEALDELDAMGNTTKAFTKAFATASGTFSTLVIFTTYSQIVGLSSVQPRLREPHNHHRPPHRRRLPLPLQQPGNRGDGEVGVQDSRGGEEAVQGEAGHTEGGGEAGLRHAAST